MTVRIRGAVNNHYMEVEVQYDWNDNMWYAWLVEANWPLTAEGIEDLRHEMASGGATFEAAMNRFLARAGRITTDPQP